MGWIPNPVTQLTGSRHWRKLELWCLPRIHGSDVTD